MAHLLRVCVVNTISFRKGRCHTPVCFLVRINQREINTGKTVARKKGLK
jgi:hypothetical protein